MATRSGFCFNSCWLTSRPSTSLTSSRRRNSSARRCKRGGIEHRAIHIPGRNRQENEHRSQDQQHRRKRAAHRKPPVRRATAQPYLRSPIHCHCPKSRRPHGSWNWSVNDQCRSLLVVSLDQYVDPTVESLTRAPHFVRRSTSSLGPGLDRSLNALAVVVVLVARPRA